MLTACSGKSLALPEVLGGKRETVTFSDSLYRPDQEFEKIKFFMREWWIKNIADDYISDM